MTDTFQIILKITTIIRSKNIKISKIDSKVIKQSGPVTQFNLAAIKFKYTVTNN